MLNSAYISILFWSLDYAVSYKRKAHVLFVGSGDVCRALQAASVANAIGQAWIEARAVVLPAALTPAKSVCALADIDASSQPLPCLDQANIAWADLLVTLDEAADQACPPLPAKVQKRCYPFPQPKNPEDWRRVRDAIQQRVEGMIGGMRMMG